MGTWVGMEFVKQHPNAVSNLVLAGAILPKSDSLESIFSERQTNQVKYLLERKTVKDLLKTYKEKGIDSLRSIQDIDGTLLSHKDLTDYWRIGFAAVNIYNMDRHHLVKGGRAYFKQDASVMVETINWKYDYRDILNDKTKTTIINGDHDFLDFNSEILKSLLKGFPKIELKVVPDAGHNSWIDKPMAFISYLENALLK